MSADWSGSVSQNNGTTSAVINSQKFRSRTFNLFWLVLIWIVLAVVLFLEFRPVKRPLPPESSLPAVGTVVEFEEHVPPSLFVDITSDAGISFTHTNGAMGTRALPETMGGGVAFFDFDNDGLPDLLLTNSAYWPGEAPAGVRPTACLYRNDGHGHFTDVTAGSGLDVEMFGMGVAVGDFDNDGLPDVLLTGVAACRLFHNEGGGKFKDVTSIAGVTASPDDWYTSAAFFDYDNDGQLDLFVGTYARWSLGTDAARNAHMAVMRYSPPFTFGGSYCRLFHNDGGGHFSDVSERSGIRAYDESIRQPAAKALGVLPIDLDGDGWMDLLVANDGVPNLCFHNEGNGRFREIARVVGIAIGPGDKNRAGMGIDGAWYRRDNAVAVAVGTFTGEPTSFFVTKNIAMLFTDESAAAGLTPASIRPLKFGTFFFDYDLDGWEDLLTVNGQLDPEVHESDLSQEYKQPAQLFWNRDGDGTFIRVLAEKCGRDLFQPIAGRGSAFGDIDGDGDLDVIMTQVSGPPILLRNDQHLGHHWLRLKLVGTTCNRDAIGAQVRVTVGGQTLIRQVMPTRSYLSQSELPVTVGLGRAARPDHVEITWPGGQKQVVSEVKVDALNVIRQAPGLPKPR